MERWKTYEAQQRKISVVAVEDNGIHDTCISYSKFYSRFEYHFVNAINNYHENDIVLLYTYTHDVFESNITLSSYIYFANNIALCSQWYFMDYVRVNGDYK